MYSNFKRGQDSAQLVSCALPIVEGCTEFILIPLVMDSGFSSMTTDSVDLVRINHVPLFDGKLLSNVGSAVSMHPYPYTFQLVTIKGVTSAVAYGNACGKTDF